MATLVITLEGDGNDLDFLRAHVMGAVEDVVAEYEQNLDEPVDIGWEFDR